MLHYLSNLPFTIIDETNFFRYLNEWYTYYFSECKSLKNSKVKRRGEVTPNLTSLGWKKKQEETAGICFPNFFINTDTHIYTQNLHVISRFHMENSTLHVWLYFTTLFFIWFVSNNFKCVYITEITYVTYI